MDVQRRRSNVGDIAVGLTLVLAQLAQSSAAELRVGVVFTSRERHVLAMRGSALAPGTRISLVTPEVPQERGRARVERALPEDDELRTPIAGPYYEVVNVETGRPLPRLAIAILGDLPAARIGRI